MLRRGIGAGRTCRHQIGKHPMHAGGALPSLHSLRCTPFAALPSLHSFAGLVCCWPSAWAPPLPPRRREGLTRAAPPRVFVAEHAPVIAAHPEPEARGRG